VLRSRLTALLAMGVLLLAMAAPAVNAASSKPPNENFGGSENSLQHRDKASGKGNFGQFHRTGWVVGQESREYSPSAVNAGSADCRQAETTFGLAAGACEDPAEAPPPGPREETGPPEECAFTVVQISFR